MSDAAQILVSVQAEVTKLQGQLDHAAALIGKKTKDIGDTAERNDPMKRWFRREQIAFALHGLGSLAGVLAGLHKAMRTGDVNAYVEAIEHLPLGMGQLAQGIHLAYDELTGFNEEMERLLKLTERQNQIQAKKTKAADEITRATQSGDSADVQRQILGAKTDEEKARIQRDFDIKRSLEEANRKARDLNDKVATQALQAEFDAKRSLAEAQYADALKRSKADPSKFIDTADTAMGAFKFVGMNATLKEQIDAQRRAAAAAEETKKHAVKHTALLEKIANKLEVFA